MFVCVRTRHISNAVPIHKTLIMSSFENEVKILLFAFDTGTRSLLIQTKGKETVIKGAVRKVAV